MTFFYDLNKKLADLATKQTLAESAEPVAERATGDYSAKKARAGKDIGKPGKMFSKIAKSAGEHYGSKERGEKVAGAVLAKLRGKTTEGEIPPEHNKPKKSDVPAYLRKKDPLTLQDLEKEKLRNISHRDSLAKNTQDDVKEADMEEGNKFTGNLMKARAAGLKKADLDGDGDMETVREADYVGLEEKKAKPDYLDLDKDGNKKETMKKAAADKKSKGTAFDPEVAKGMFAHKDDKSRYDVKDTGYSKRYTRKADPEDEQDDEVKSDAPKKKGRPKGPDKGPERTTKGAWKHKGERKKKTDEDLDTDGVMMTRPSNMSSEDVSVKLVDKGEFDREGEMAKQQIHTIMRAAKKLHNMLGDDDNLPEWVQKKITLAQNYIDGVSDYLTSQRAEDGEERPVAEKAVSKAQRAAAGIAYAAKKGEIPKSELRGASKEMSKMASGELKKFAKTKEKGLPEKVKETDSEPKAKKSSGGFQFGKGVYENLDKKYTQLLNEGMNVTVNMGTDANGQSTKNITVSAEGEEAEALAKLLQMAGLGGNSKENSCTSCGTSPCGCAEQVDENSPDWPTNTETSDDALQYSGGLNKPKSTGQTTVPVIASQLRRQVSMEESVELERSLFQLYQDYKAK